MKKSWPILFLAVLLSCKTASVAEKKPFVWGGSNLYFLLTDRFRNGDPTNDVNFGRTAKAGFLRGFEGGDLKGITDEIKNGYFTRLGVNAIWMTPLVEQIHGYTDEGQGITYGYHGYWAKDWTALDPNFGTRKDLKDFVKEAHRKGIRVVLDVVINHTGPVTAQDPVYPPDWVRTSPKCTYTGYTTTTACTLVDNLPDILTEENTDVALPPALAEKWKKENRYEQEMQSLDAFFRKYQFPRAPKYYIMKWLADYILTYGIDGFRVDTVKHVNEDAWKQFEKVCQDAFAEFKRNHPSEVVDDNGFFIVGEVYGYGISQKHLYNFGDRSVDYYKNGFNGLINFDFKGDAQQPYEQTFAKYSKILHNDLKGYTVMNYISSHDDDWPFDKKREKPYESATKLLLAPGISQIYYGDETARPLQIPKAEGDANLRGLMNWDDIENNPETQKILQYWQALGKFRAAHPAVGAGVHQMISSKPYYFTRTYSDGHFTDKVLIGLDLDKGEKVISVKTIFEDGSRLRDAFSGKKAKVKNGSVTFDTENTTVLIEKL